MQSDGRTICTHLVLLSIISARFTQIFEDAPVEIVHIPYLSFNELKFVLCAMYAGRFEHIDSCKGGLDNSQIVQLADDLSYASLLMFAVDFSIAPLRKHARKMLIYELNARTFHDALLVANVARWVFVFDFITELSFSDEVLITACGCWLDSHEVSAAFVAYYHAGDRGRLDCYEKVKRVGSSVNRV